MHAVRGVSVDPVKLAPFVDPALLPPLAVRLKSLSGEADDPVPDAALLDDLRDKPTLILLDGMAVSYRRAPDAYLDFLHAAFRAVAQTPHTALCYTLASGNDDLARDPYREENREPGGPSRIWHYVSPSCK
jgi:hypothetical protein